MENWAGACGTSYNIIVHIELFSYMAQSNSVTMNTSQCNGQYYWYNARCVCAYKSNRVEVIIWKIMEWSIQVATGYQRVINWEGVELEIAIKSLLDLYI